MVALVETSIVTLTVASQYPLNLLNSGRVPLTVAAPSGCPTRPVKLPVYRQLPPAALPITNCPLVTAAVPNGLPVLSPVIEKPIGVPPRPAPVSQIAPVQPYAAALTITPLAPSAVPASLNETALNPQFPLPSNGDVTLTLPVSTLELYGSFGAIAADDVPVVSTVIEATIAATAVRFLNFMSFPLMVTRPCR